MSLLSSSRLLLLLSLSPIGARAFLLVPSIFSDGCVLQTNAEYGARSYVYGWASPGDAVAVSLTVSGGGRVLQNLSTTASAQDGAWSVTLNPLAYTMPPFDIAVTAASGGEHAARGCVAGDVYVCGGQSNMCFSAEDAFAPAASLVNTTYDNIKLFSVQMLGAPTPQRDFLPVTPSSQCTWNHDKAPNQSVAPCQVWLQAEPRYNAHFSAVCLFTALEVRRLHTGPARPIGLVYSAFGGTSVSLWAPPAALAGCPGTDNPAPPPGSLYNAMIAPLERFSLRAFLYFQGENDAGSEVTTPGFYACRFERLIKYWRSRWAMGDVAFCFVQLGPVVGGGDSYGLVRAAQALALPRPGGPLDITGMAVAHDLGDASSPYETVHFRNKTEVGRRLAAAVLRAQFALQNASLVGPAVRGFSSVSAAGVTIELDVADGAGAALQPSGECSECCAAGDTVQLSADGGASWCNTTLAMAADGASVVATAASGCNAAAPFTHAQHAFQNYPQCSIKANGNSFPVPAFRMAVAAPGAVAAPAVPAAPAALAAPTAPRRRVNWYLSAANVADNAALIAAHGNAISGGYLCCGFGGVNASGAWRSQPEAEALAQMSPLTEARLEVWMVSGISEAAVHSGAWVGGLADAAAALAPLAKAGLAGLIIDYEPTDNYTVAHATAFASYLSALAAALKTLGLSVGMDIAGWTILAPQFWPLYLAGGGVSRFTSMTPTYDASNLTESRLFVGEALRALPAGAYAAGIGSVLAPDQQPRCVSAGMDFKWTSADLVPFVAWLGEAGVDTIDVWRCDIDSHYPAPDPTAPWLFDALSTFLGAAPAPAVARGGELMWKERTYSWTGATPPPPMGMNTWNAFHVNIDENIVLALADAFVSLGLKTAGYSYINIDDGFVSTRDARSLSLAPPQTLTPRILPTSQLAGGAHGQRHNRRGPAALPLGHARAGGGRAGARPQVRPVHVADLAHLPAAPGLLRLRGGRHRALLRLRHRLHQGRHVRRRALARVQHVVDQNARGHRGVRRRRRPPPDAQRRVLRGGRGGLRRVDFRARRPLAHDGRRAGELGVDP